jgi:hypothetical protein
MTQWPFATAFAIRRTRHELSDCVDFNTRCPQRKQCRAREILVRKETNRHRVHRLRRDFTDCDVLLVAHHFGGERERGKDVLVG